MKIIHNLLAGLLITIIFMGGGFPPNAIADNYTTTYTYDDLGRPISVRVVGSSADFAYDAVGNRNVVSLSPGSTAPTVLVVSPPAGATAISPHVTVAATFSRPVDPATVTTGPTGTFYLSGPGSVSVPGTVSVHGLEAVFVSGAPLQNGTQYTATVTTGVKDLANRALTQQRVWSFTTGTAPDLAPPTVISTSPASGAANVPVTGVISALFSEALDPTTVNSTSFLVMNGAYEVPATIDYNAATRTAQFSPDGPLEPGTTFVAALLTTITDVSGNRLAANREWTFTTASSGSPVTPAADTLIPYDAQTDIPLRTSVGAIFNKAMAQNTINGSTFTVKKGSVAVSGAVSYNPIKHQATFIPTAALDPETVYTATLTTGITDAAGAPLPETLSWSFTTTPLPPFLVTCNLAGAGSGSIESTPPNIACGTGSCSGDYPRKSTVLLHPVPDDTSLFSGWGTPCTGTGDCSFTLNADTTLTATFNLKPARIAGTLPQYFTSLQLACNGATLGNTVQVRTLIFTENLILNRPVNVLIKGGYDSSYGNAGGVTTIDGSLKIRSGTVRVDKVKIK